MSINRTTQNWPDDMTYDVDATNDTVYIEADKPYPDSRVDQLLARLDFNMHAIPCWDRREILPIGGWSTRAMKQRLPDEA